MSTACARHLGAVEAGIEVVQLLERAADRGHVGLGLFGDLRHQLELGRVDELDGYAWLIWDPRTSGTLTTARGSCRHGYGGGRRGAGALRDHGVSSGG